MNFDEIMNNPVLRAFADKQFLAGTYHKIKQGSSGRWGVDIGGEFYTSPLQLFAFKEKSQFRRQDEISLDVKDRTGRILESRLGPQRYFGLESVMRKASGAQGYQGLRIVRESYGVHPGGVKDLYDRMMSEGVAKGFIVPDDESTTLVRAFLGDVEMTTQQIEEMLGKIGWTVMGEQMGSSAAAAKLSKAGGKDLAKLMKRLKVLTNIERFGLENGSPFKAHLISRDQAMDVYASMIGQGPQEKALAKFGIQQKVGQLGEKEIDKMFEGFSIVNPQVIRRAKDQMEQDLKKMEAALADMQINGIKGKLLDVDDPNLKAIQMTISKKVEEIKELDEVIRKGGRLQDFRMRGFDGIFGGMIKGDAGVIAQSQWEAQAKMMARMLGISEKEALNLDVIAYEGNVSYQLGYQGGRAGSLTFKPTHTNAFSWVDPQFQMAFPEAFGLTETTVKGQKLKGFTELSQHNQEIFQTWMQDMANPATSSIPKTYRTMLEKLVGYSGGADELANIRKLLGLSRDVSDQTVMDAYRTQKQKALRILSMEEMGFTPATNRQMFREVGEGLIDFMQKSQLKPDQLRAMIPFSAQGHAVSDFWTKLMGVTDVVPPGTATFDNALGMIYSAVNAPEFMGLHGGGDFDDLIQAMLRWDPKNKNFMFVNRRSPGGIGEILGVEVNRDSVAQFAKTLMKDAAVNRKTARALYKEVDASISSTNPLIGRLLGGRSILGMDDPSAFLTKWVKTSGEVLRTDRYLREADKLSRDIAGLSSIDKRLQQMLQKALDPSNPQRLSKGEVQKLRQFLDQIPGGKKLTERDTLIKALLDLEKKKSKGAGYFGTPGNVQSLHAIYQQARQAREAELQQTMRDLNANFKFKSKSAAQAHMVSVRKSLGDIIGVDLDTAGIETQDIRQGRSMIVGLRDIITGQAGRNTGWEDVLTRAMESGVVPELTPEAYRELTTQGVYHRAGGIIRGNQTPPIMEFLDKERVKVLEEGTGWKAPKGMSKAEAAEVRKVYKQQEDILSRYAPFINIEEFKKLEDVFTADQLSALTDVQRAALAHANRAEQGEHILGTYSLLKEWIDQIARDTASQSFDADKLLRPFMQETVIDTLAQGVWDDLVLNPDIIQKRTYAMLGQIADFAASGDIKLDPARLDALRTGGLHKTLIKMLESQDISIQDVTADTGEELGSILARSRTMQREMRRTYEDTFQKAYSNIPEFKFIDRHYFNEDAIKDAEQLAEAFRSGFSYAEAGGDVVSPERQLEVFGELINGDMDSQVVQVAREEMRRALAGMFKEDNTGKMVMGSRAINALGAYVQRYGTSGTLESRAFGGDLTRPLMKTFAHFAQGSSDPSAHLLAQSDWAKEVISKNELLSGISEEFVSPGMKRMKLGERAWEKAEGVIKGIKGPQGWEAGEAAAALMGKPLFRKGAIAAGLLVGGSVLYRKLTDRTQEDISGPPFLPGGEFYDQMPQSSPPPIGNEYSAPSRGGITYKVRARGNFDPEQLAKQAEFVSGGSATGSVYQSPQQGRKRETPFDALRHGGFR